MPGDLISGSPLIAIATTELLLDAGDINGALATWPSDLSPSNLVVRIADARLKCASGRLTAGLAQFQKVIDELSLQRSANDPSLARYRSSAGLCALALGNRKLAEELARNARRAFTAQPEVSPYFKEPLKRLEQQLGIKSI